VRSTAAERARDDLVARVALEERMRVAQEVHDVAGHGFAAVAMQAGVALLVLEERPDQARHSLEAIRETSTTALTELRATLDAFHPPGEARPVASSAAGAAPIGDEIGLGGLPALVDHVQAGGLPVDLQVERTDVTLPPEIDAVAYRVVQEALTNVLRHAGPTRALVRVSWEDDQVVVQVADRGRGTVQAAPVGGRGLSGMRARVEAAGGSLATGSHDGGGFQVVARLPLAGGAG
jgi:signal transduction histidine kinase